MVIKLSMQYFVKKIFTVLFTVSSVALMSRSFHVDSLLTYGDLSFKNGRYAQAKTVYEQLVNNERLVSEKILYRLCLISEKTSTKKDELLYATMLYRFYPRAKNWKLMNDKTNDLAGDTFFSSASSWFSLKLEWWSRTIYLILFLLVILSSGITFFLWLRRNSTFKFVGVCALVFVFFLFAHQAWLSYRSPILSYFCRGNEVFYKKPSYASDRIDSERLKNSLLFYESTQSPWLKLVTETDTLYLPEKEQPFLF